MRLLSGLKRPDKALREPVKSTAGLMGTVQGAGVLSLHRRHVS